MVGCNTNDPRWTQSQLNEMQQVSQLLWTKWVYFWISFLVHKGLYKGQNSKHTWCQFCCVKQLDGANLSGKLYHKHGQTEQVQFSKKLNL